MEKHTLAPFVYFGGKRRVADVVWSRLGNVDHYIEPFFGGGAVLLSRPHRPRVEVVNDIDAYIANFWRAVAAEPIAVAKHLKWPVNETDLGARHRWLTEATRNKRHRRQMRNDPAYYDSEIAAWWLWGMHVWWGAGWCNEIWHGHRSPKNKGRMHDKKPQVISGIGAKSQKTLDVWMINLSKRLQRVVVCCGDWSRVCTDSMTSKDGITGVFLDPPYSTEDREMLYTHESTSVGHAAHEWAMKKGDSPNFRIALCGYEGEYKIPSSWTTYKWKGGGRLAKGGAKDKRSVKNARRERIWFSPHCLTPGGSFGLFG